MRYHRHEMNGWLGIVLALSLALGIGEVARGVTRGWGDLPFRGVETLAMLAIAAIVVWVTALNDRDGG